MKYTAKATDFARVASENASVFVVARGGVYWLSIKTGDMVRSLMAVGFDKSGIKDIRREIAAYFSAR